MPEVEIDSGRQHEQRRSSRVFIRVPVHVEGRNSQGRQFREKSETVVVNAHGGLLYLNETVGAGMIIVLTNPMTQEQQECRVVYMGDASTKGQRVGVEFLSPAPRFWGIEFPPEDWGAGSTSSPRPN